MVLELERLWDFAATDVPAAMFPAFAWGEYLDEHGEAIGVARKDAVRATGEVTFTGEDGTFVGVGVEVGTAQPDPDGEPTSYVTTESGTVTGGELTVAIEALEPGPASNVAAGAVEFILSPTTGFSAVTNADPIAGGLDVESDEAYQGRLLGEMIATQGAGSVADYRRWCLAYPGVGFVRVIPLWAGAGTVRCVVTDPNNDPVPGAVESGLQTRLDPTPGMGLGLAPVGATVTVDTPAALTINVVAQVDLLAGYSLDGDGGTIAVREEIRQAISDYVDRLVPGDDVILNHVESRFFRVRGVYNTGTITLNGSPANVSVGDLQVPALGSLTLTEI